VQKEEATVMIFWSKITRKKQVITLRITAAALTTIIITAATFRCFTNSWITLSYARLG
jgi:hypothetical protein